MEKIEKNESMFFRFLPLKTASFAFLPLAILLTLFVFITFIAFMLLGLADFIDFITVFIVGRTIVTQQERLRSKQREAKKLEPGSNPQCIFTPGCSEGMRNLSFLWTNSGGGVKSQEHSQVRLSFPPKGEAPNGDGAAPA